MCLFGNLPFFFFFLLPFFLPFLFSTTEIAPRRDFYLIPGDDPEGFMPSRSWRDRGRGKGKREQAKSK